MEDEGGTNQIRKAFLPSGGLVLGTPAGPTILSKEGGVEEGGRTGDNMMKLPRRTRKNVVLHRASGGDEQRSLENE